MGRTRELMDMIKERRFGFRMSEVMRGEHEFTDGRGPQGKLPIEFRVSWGARHLARWFNPWSPEFLLAQLEGTITVGGLCREAPCQGTLQLRYVQDRTIRYDFGFEVDGVAYRFIGEKVNLRLWNLAVSHTRRRLCLLRSSRPLSGCLALAIMSK